MENVMKINRLKSANTSSRWTYFLGIPLSIGVSIVLSFPALIHCLSTGKYAHGGKRLSVGKG